MIVALAFLYGTFIGSFLNVCIFRIPRGSSIVFPRSSCPHCKELIRWWQNLPVVSYLLLRGRCHACGSPISPRYALVEILTGVLLAYLWFTDRAPVPFIFHSIFACSLIVVTFIDWDYQLVFDSTLYPAAAAGIIYNALNHQWLSAVLAGVAAALFFYSIRVLGEFVFLKEAMGMGDVKLAAMLGLCLGPQGTALAVLLSFPIGAFAALALIVAGIKNRKDHIPFGPAMAAGGMIAMLWGNRLLEWYLNR